MAKKDFTKTPDFFNQEGAGREQAAAAAAILNPFSVVTGVSGVEVKDKRVQLVFRRSTHAIAKAKAQELGISLNEYIHRLIEQDNSEIVNRIKEK
jgi:predicted HicB family RNase H-like nuclease